MANPWQYSRARRIATQIVMWVILGGTVLLAALVSSYRRNALQVALAPPETIKGITIQIPRRWDS